jgi:hypothetical protein
MIAAGKGRGDGKRAERQMIVWLKMCMEGSREPFVNRDVMFVFRGHEPSTFYPNYGNIYTYE